VSARVVQKVVFIKEEPRKRHGISSSSVSGSMSRREDRSVVSQGIVSLQNFKVDGPLVSGIL
jgi:hypothetical protein